MCPVCHSSPITRLGLAAQVQSTEMSCIIEGIDISLVDNEQLLEQMVSNGDVDNVVWTQ